MATYTIGLLDLLDELFDIVMEQVVFNSVTDAMNARLTCSTLVPEDYRQPD
jgi:hypothetical protein